MIRQEVGVSAEPRVRKRPSFFQRLRANTGALIGAILVTLVLLIAILSPFISPYDPIEIDLGSAYLPPGRDHLFGTDTLGRDILSRVLAGAGISFRIVVLVLATAVSIGMLLGTIAGYWGSVADEVIMRLADIFLAFPSFLLAMAITAALGQSLDNAVVAVAITLWPTYARLVRGQILTIKNEPYVEAARAIGASSIRIVTRHILPNCLSPILVQSAMHAGNAILMTAALSFVGLGASPPSPEWGAMVAETRRYMTNYWWMPTFPGIAIAITVGGYMYLGDGLRDILDPRLWR